MNKIIGIDLGTTNSVVAVTEGTKPTVIVNSEGLRTTASIVAYTKKQELLVGQVAKRQAVINAENTFYSIKRFIGSKASEISTALKEVPYKVIEDDKKNIKLDCPALNKQFSPEEISSQILRKLVEDAEKYIGQTINEAVITVPAYFNDSQRQATKDAGKIAGLNVRRILNEPTAAALAYGLDQNKSEIILVFDLGGGTFDVSILEVGDGIFEVLSTAGDTKLGGDNFDGVIVKYLADNFEKTENINLRTNNQALQRLTEAAEKAKVELSSINETTINLPFITATEDGPKHIETNLTRDQFELLSDDLIHKCRIPVENAMSDAKLKKEQIDQVVLVGGSTRIPAIQQIVKRIIDKDPNQTVNPDEVVAIGAALQGGVIAGEVKDILLLDVTPLSLGVETLGSILTKIIPRNTTIPIRKSEVFSTANDDQSNVEIHVLQGEREFATDNKSLGRFKLTELRAAKRGEPQIEVTFDIDVNGILSVKASDKNSGNTVSITIEGSSTLDTSEIDEMIENAEKFAASDKEKRKAITLKNETDSLCYQASELLKKVKENSTLNQDMELLPKIKETQTIIENLKTSINNQNLDQKLVTTQTSKLKDLMVLISDKLNVTELD